MLVGLLLAFLTTTVQAKPLGHCTDSSPITFGILPFVSAKQLVIRFTPLVDYLSRHLKAVIRIETAPNFTEFSQRTVQGGHYDILFTAPHFYPLAQKSGYRLIASVDSPGMRAVIVVPKKSKIYGIEDLKGKHLATVEAKSLVTLLLRKYLMAHSINPDKDLLLISTPTHDASLLSTYHGVTDASALMQPPYAAASQQVRDSMRIIAKTETAPHIPISVGPRISETCAKEISQLLLAMSGSDEGRRVLVHNRFAGFRASKANEYEHIKSLMQH